MHNERCTSGSVGGPEKPIGRKADRALRFDPTSRRRIGDGAQIYSRHRHDIKGRRMVLGHVIAVEPGFLDRFYILDAFVQKPLEREPIRIQMVKDAKFHLVDPIPYVLSD